MKNTNDALKVVTLEDGSSAVVKIDPANPRFLEVVATFYDAERAYRYTSCIEGERDTPVAAAAAPVLPSPPQEKKANSNGATANVVAVNGAVAELSSRQSAVLQALRAKMDGDKQVEAKAATLAEAAQVPLGSLHSILSSLEKKQYIANRRAGSPKAPAVYEVLKD